MPGRFIATMAVALGLAATTIPAAAQKTGPGLRSGHVICNAEKTKCYVCPSAQITPACRPHAGPPPPEKWPNPNALPIGAELCELNEGNRARNAAGNLVTVDLGRYKAAPPVPSFNRVPLPRVDIQIDGTSGRTLAGGQNRGHYDFAWRPGSVVPLLARAGTLLAAFPRTTHYELCTFADTERARCDSPGLIQGRIADFRWDRGITHAQLPCGARGGRSPWYVGSFDHLTEIQRLFWKVRACNAGRCSAWSAERSVTWVPAPLYVSPAANATIDAPYGFSWTNVPGAESYRLCLGSGANTCTLQHVRGPQDPELFRISQPTGANSGRNPGHTLNDTLRYRGQTQRWRAGTCVEVTGRPQVTDCVYTPGWRAITFR